MFILKYVVIYPEKNSLDNIPETINCLLKLNVYKVY